MVRNILIHSILVGVVWTSAGGLAGAQDKVREDVSSQVSTLSLGQLILRDTFSDDKVGSMWRVWADDVNNCWVTETNGRLELRAKRAASDVFSGYIANAWRLDPRDDFSMKVDFHFDLKAMEKGWVSLGIAPSSHNPRVRRIDIDARCANLGKSFKYEGIDSSSMDSSYGERFTDDGSLFVSYSAAEDTLYVSMGGYGPENAWGVFPGWLQGLWAGEPVSVCVGGGSDGLEISSGHAYIDNLMVESGTIVEASLQEVYHFKSSEGVRHFYTMSKTEKEELLKDSSRTWVYDGPVFYAFPDDSDPDCKPVYRFWSNRMGSHFYTMSEAEKDQLIDVWGWVYEGVAFYAYPAGSQPDWARPVYRFWSQTYGSHFYTIDEAEKSNLINKSSNVWAYEGIAWYAIR